MSPALACSRPAIMRSKVVLPQPDGPRRTVNSPLLISRSSGGITSTLPKDFATLRNSMPDTRRLSSRLLIAERPEQRVQAGIGCRHRIGRALLARPGGEELVIDDALHLDIFGEIGSERHHRFRLLHRRQERIA